MDLETLKRSGIDELEALFAHERPIDMPEGCYRGHHLIRLSNPGARGPLAHLSEAVGFQFLPFGVDFDTRKWYFVSPLLQVGAFTPTEGRSRWRNTRVIRLDYQVSGLPGIIRNILYDEVKPLDDHLCLGLGGLDGGPGEGDHFFFAMERIQ